MSDTATYVYAGNRSAVLRRMLALGLRVRHVMPAADSWLAREAPELHVPATPISSKAEACELLHALDFDVFVACGFPFILPISQLRVRHPNATFVNIHPSYLPDLRGADPIPGAILLGKDSGVTCHLMDDGIDTGPIVCQRSIRYFDGLDSKLLYHLCFRLEPAVFEEALASRFAPAATRTVPPEGTDYYTYTPTDSAFTPNDDDDEMIRRIRAFNTPGKGFRFSLNGVPYHAFEGATLGDESILRMFGKAHRDEIVAVFEDSMLVMRDRGLIRLSNVDPRPTSELVGLRLGT